MKFRQLLQLLLKMSRVTLHALLVNTLLLSTIYGADDLSAQTIKSIREVSIQLNLKNAGLVEIFQLIEAKTDYQFSYKAEDLDQKVKIDRNFDRASIADILLEVSRQSHLQFKQVNEHIHVSKMPKRPIPAVTIVQQISISGQVTSFDENEPLPGVNIIEKGTNNGTVTDVEGRYTLEVEEGATLVFSSVGFLTEEVQVADQTVIDVALVPDIQSLGEVVVTALGIKREERTLGYAVSEVDGEELAQTSTVNPVNALQGKLAGVQINTTSGGTYGGARITIRGNSTLGGNTQPIFVVDGIVLDNETSGVSGTDWGNQLKNLNADDFESVSVLKGAAATALYGSRALNGVVLITTKSGHKRKGLGVSIKQTSGIRHVYAAPDFQNEYGYGPTAGMFSNDLTNGRPDGDKHDNQQFANYEMVNGEYVPSLRHNMSEENAASWGPRFEGQDYIDYDGSMAQWVAQPDNYKEMFDLGTINNTNVAIEGAGDRNTFRLSYSNFSETGVHPGNDFIKNSFSLKGTQELVKDVVKVGANVQYTRSKAKNPPTNLLLNGWFHDGFPRSYDVNKWRNNYKDVDGGVPYPTESGLYMYTKKSQSWFEIYERDIERNEGSLLAQGDVEINIAEGIQAKIEGSINQFTYKGENKTAATSMDRLSDAFYSLEHGEKFQSTLTANVSLNKRLSDAFNIDVLVGGQLWNTRSTSSGAHTDRGFKVRDFYNIANSLNSPIFTGGIGFNKTINSVYSYVNLDWKSTLYLSLTGRNDWSSALAYPDGGGNTSYFYPSASLAWVLNESIPLPESLFAKLRASYAYVGNDTDPYNLSSGFVIEEFNEEPNMKLYKYKDAVAVSPNLKPESKRSFETGLDLRLMNGRAGLDFAYYRDNTRDQILTLNVPSESGINQQLINAGNLQNQGVELTLYGTPIETTDFSWDIGMAFTHNRDKIIEMYPGIEEVVLHGNPSDANAGTATVAYAGGDYGMIATRLGYTFYNGANTANHGKPVLSHRNNWTVSYLNGRGNMDSLLVMGNMQPDWYGSINTSVRYKNFNLYALFDMSFGGDIYSHTYRYGLHQGVIESSLPNRDASKGGITWVSEGFGDNHHGKTYYDGYIPEGVFPDGTVVSFKQDGVVTESHDVGGMTYQEAYEQGLVEPTHWSGYIYRWTSASTGTPQMAIFESNWVVFRELTLSYTLPQNALKRLFVQNASLALTARDIGFIHNSLPDNINPIISNNAAGNALQMGLAPYVRSVTLTLNCSF